MPVRLMTPIESLEPRRLLSALPAKVRINFQPESSPVPDYYRVDYGMPFGLRGNGMSYGWDVDNRVTTRARNDARSADSRYDTLAHLQKPGGARTWEMAVPNGRYTVRVVAGDAGYTDGIFRTRIEGVLALSGQPSADARWVEGVATVDVTDRRLTITSGEDAVNNKISFVEIVKGEAAMPIVWISADDPAASESGDGGSVLIRRRGDATSAVRIEYRVGGTATSGSDYEPLVGSVVLAAGEKLARVPIQPIDDALVEGPETVVVSLVSSYDFSLEQLQQATVTIADNDTPVATGKLVWARGADAVARTEQMAAMVGGKLYQLGGYFNNKYLSTAYMDVYDPATNRFTRLADLPHKLSHSGCAADDRFIYLAGGYTVNDAGTKQVFGLKTVRRYDTVTGQWSLMTDLPFHRGAGTMVLLGRTLYFLGGVDNNNRVDRREVFTLDLDTPGATWQTRAPLPEANNHFSAVVVDGKIYVMGGQTGQDETAVFKSTCYRYDPATNQWSAIASLPNTPRSHTWASTVVHQGKVYMMGGETRGREIGKPQMVKLVSVYDPATNRWSEQTPLDRGRSSGVAAVWNDKLIFTTGMEWNVFRHETYIGSFTG